MVSGASRAAKRKFKSLPRGGEGRAESLGHGGLASLWARPWIFAVVLAVITTAVYIPVHSHPFFNMDDQQYVVNNARIQNGFDGEMLAWAFTTYDLANWHPVT